MSDVVKFPPRGKHGRLRARVEGDRVIVEVVAPWLDGEIVAVTMNAASADALSASLAAYANEIRRANTEATHAKITAEAPAKRRSLIRLVKRTDR